jgi:large subunit ribosomal protein L13
MKYTIDASHQSLGRMASKIASILNGKEDVTFAKNIIADVQVEVINASKVKVTGSKMKESTHKRYSGKPGGLTIENYEAVVAKKGYAELIRHAVEGMLPKNKLQNERMKLLTIIE